MIPSLEDILRDETLRNREFPVTRKRIFMAHAGVAPLTHRAAEAMASFARKGSTENQEGAWVWPEVLATRKAAAKVIGCGMDEVSLLGPTSLGLSLVALGLAWEAGDEVVYYPDDYPANVYPWTGLGDRGVRPIPLRPDGPGRITWELVAAALTPRTRLVALASCHFLTGYRIDVERIGHSLRERGVLFCLDGIQTVGAFPTPAGCVDFMAADSHKWMLGPVGAGIFYVRKEIQDQLAPALRGSWNIRSPDFIAQERVEYEKGGRRFEPGTLNLPGIVGMKASLDMLSSWGMDTVAGRMRVLRGRLAEGLQALGFMVLGGETDPDGVFPDTAVSSIVTFHRSGADMLRIAEGLAEEKVDVSHRMDREGTAYLRISPHAYNTDAEVGRVLELLRRHAG